MGLTPPGQPGKGRNARLGCQPVKAVEAVYCGSGTGQAGAATLGPWDLGGPGGVPTMYIDTWGFWDLHP